MTHMGFEYNALVTGKADWEDLAQAMTSASSELSGAATSGLAPEVASAARSFLTAWSGFTQQSSEIASGFAEALGASAESYVGTDESAQGAFDDLDGRLGPAR